MTVQIGETKVSATPNAEDEWKMAFPAQKAGGPLKLLVSGANTVRFNDVLVGEVWLCSEQSNMEMGIAAPTRTVRRSGC